MGVPELIHNEFGVPDLGGGFLGDRIIHMPDLSLRHMVEEEDFVEGVSESTLLKVKQTTEVDYSIEELAHKVRTFRMAIIFYYDHIQNNDMIDESFVGSYFDNVVAKELSIGGIYHFKVFVLLAERFDLRNIPISKVKSFIESHLFTDHSLHMIDLVIEKSGGDFDMLYENLSTITQNGTLRMKEEQICIILNKYGFIESFDDVQDIYRSLHWRVNEKNLALFLKSNPDFEQIKEYIRVGLSHTHLGKLLINAIPDNVKVLGEHGFSLFEISYEVLTKSDPDKLQLLIDNGNKSLLIQYFSIGYGKHIDNEILGAYLFEGKFSLDDVLKVLN